MNWQDKLVRNNMGMEERDEPVRLLTPGVSFGIAFAKMECGV